MDPEKRARRQSLRIIVSECFMVLTVIVTVAILALVVSGYWVGSDFKVERQGMLQISSLPTGADVIVDNEFAWNQRTNTSKVLSSGEHTIELKKEGYDSWSRTINIAEGLLYRVHYPRLFPLERQKESVMSVGDTNFAIVSPNREYALTANNTTSWELLKITDDEIASTDIDVSTVFSYISLAPGAEKGLFMAKIISAEWDYNNEHVLMQVQSDTAKEWVVLNVKNPKESVNLTRDFNADFSNIKIQDQSANTLLAVLDGNLHKISLPSKQVSAVLVKNVKSFDYLGPDVVFSAQDDANTFYVGELMSDNKINKIFSELEKAPKVSVSRFYDEKYITTLDANVVTVYNKKDHSEYIKKELGFAPETLKVGHEGEFITMTAGPQIATVDMEAKEVREWSPESNYYGWLDSDMLYSINDGELIVYDFDGLNRRVLAKNVSSHFPVTIAGEKWLYYASDDNLIREKIND